MQKTILITVLALIFASQSNAQYRRKSESSSKFVITLTKEIFLSQVAEMSKKTWKYIGDKPALINFYADWCRPCRIMTPIMEELAEKYKDEIYIYKVRVETESELARMFKVNAIPYILIIPMNKAPQFMESAAPKHYLEAIIEEFLLEKAAMGMSGINFLSPYPRIQIKPLLPPLPLR